MKKLITLISFLLIAILSFSQSSQTRLGDTITLRIPYKYILAANKSYIEVKGLRAAFASSQRETYVANARIKFLELALQNSLKSDSICSEQKSILEKKFDAADIERLKISQEFKRVKRGKIALSITTPLGIVGSFVAGFFLHKALTH